ncbi:MAG: MoaD/ThiS family protein [Planctomycetota bacterium]
MTGTAPRVKLQLPRVLEPAVGRVRMELTGCTITEALQCAFAQLPSLQHHLMLESGELRPHILCLVNDSLIDRKEHATKQLADGDEILIHQAISGG